MNAHKSSMRIAANAHTGVSSESFLLPREVNGDAFV